MKIQSLRNIRSRGFTLTELLVVIAIIVILVALGMGGIFKFRKSADKAVVLGNMRNLQLTNIQWASDNNGRFISIFSFDENAKATGRWYMNSEFLGMFSGDREFFQAPDNYSKVPVSLLDPKVAAAKKPGWQELRGNYGYIYDNMPGGEYSSKNTDRGYRVSQITDPVRTAAFISSTDWIAKYSGSFLWEGSNVKEGQTGDGKIAFRHDGKAAVVYYDGHVEFISKADLKKINSKGGAKNAFWNGRAY